MADKDSLNVSVGKGKTSGYAYVAPSSVTAPTDATTALASGYVSLGYISEDGITNSFDSDSEDYKDMNGDTIYSGTTSRTETFQLTLVETKKETLIEAFGDDNVEVDGSGNITVKSNNATRASKRYVFELVLNNNRVERVVIPNGKVTEVGDITVSSGELLGYEITITAALDENGNSSYRYISKLASA